MGKNIEAMNAMNDISAIDGNETVEELARCRGNIFNIQYFCIHDGPGIRATVFLKGCPLRCVWCHNPEGISRGPLLSYAKSKCALCGACVKACPEAHSIVDGEHIVNWSGCKVCEACGACADARTPGCVDVCVTGALSIVGKETTAGEVVAEAAKDTRYFISSGGGVTLSGGEPTMQPRFLYALLRTLKEMNIHTAVETSGLCDYGVLEAILPYTDLFLYDCKETDPELHKKFTGVDDALIRANRGKLHDAGAEILLRCPIVHGLNDRDGHFQALAEIARELPRLQGIELLPYHKLGASKAGRMGLAEPREYEQVSAEVAAGWRAALRGYGANVVEM